MENCPFIDDFPIETSIYKGFSMVMLNNQRVYIEPVTNCDDHKYLSGGPIPNMGQSQRCVISRTVRITLQTLHSSMCVFTLSYNCMKR